METLMTNSIVTEEFTDANGETIYLTKIGIGPTVAASECAIDSAAFLAAYNARSAVNISNSSYYKLVVEVNSNTGVKTPTNIAFMTYDGWSYVYIVVEDPFPCSYATTTTS